MVQLNIHFLRDIRDIKDMQTTLFRRQAMEFNTNRLHGDVFLLPRFNHTVLITIVGIWLVCFLIFLATFNYSRHETINGWIEPTSGIVHVYSEGSGTVDKIFVSEGQSVKKGQALFRVNSDKYLENGNQLQSRLLSELDNQKQLLRDKIHQIQIISAHQAQRKEQQIKSAKKDLLLLNKQNEMVSERLQLITSQSKRASSLREKGLVSIEEVEILYNKELSLKSEKQGLLRDKGNRTSQIKQLQAELDLLPMEKKNSLGDVRSRLSELTQRIAQLNSDTVYIVKAVRAGVISNLQIKQGQRITLGSKAPLLSVSPSDSSLKINFLVPVRSAGFIESGQHIDVKYDAFPYQKFGTYSGRLNEVSTTVLLPSELLNTPVAVKEPTYRVTATLDRTNVEAYGKLFNLKAGMTLSANVKLSERTLLQWLLEPIYSLRGRL